MHKIRIIFSGSREEKMLMRSVRQTSDIINALRSRGTLHVSDGQLDVEDNFNEGILHLSDALTGEHILSVLW